MASLAKAINKEFFESVLPTFGNPRVQAPIWDNGQRMFIENEHESAKGNRYYRGIRFSDRIVMVEHVGLFTNWTYIDGIELYAFNGKKLELIQKREYDKVFRNEAFIRAEAEAMLIDFFDGMAKVNKMEIADDELSAKAKNLVDETYKSFLDDDYNTKLNLIISSF